MTQTLQQAIDAVMELDGRREGAGIWYSIGVGETDFLIAPSGWNPAEYQPVIGQIRDKTNAAFIASAPQMAQIIRKQAAMIEGLREIAERRVGWQVALKGIHERDGSPFLDARLDGDLAAITAYNTATMTMED